MSLNIGEADTVQRLLRVLQGEQPRPDAGRAVADLVNRSHARLGAGQTLTADDADALLAQVHAAARDADLDAECAQFVARAM